MKKRDRQTDRDGKKGIFSSKKKEAGTTSQCRASQEQNCHLSERQTETKRE